MDDLSTALRELAGTATAPGVSDPGRLWQRGRARVRRRRITAVLAAAVVAVAGYAAVAQPTPTVVMPSGPVHEPAIPKNIYSPTRFLAGLDSDGPGQLAALGQTERLWFGISATDGSYVRLDLPALSEDPVLRLSPDGKSIAYSLANPKSPGTETARQGPVSGIGVYDTMTGKVTRQDIPTDFGIEGGWDRLHLSWLDPSHVVYGYMTVTDRGDAISAGAYVWDYANSSLRRFSDDSAAGHIVRGWSPSEFVVNAGSFRVVDQNGELTGLGMGPVYGGGPFDASVSGRRFVATTSLGETNGLRVLTGIAPRLGGKVPLHIVTDLQTPTLLGWLSQDTVLVSAPRRGLHAVDLAKETSVRLGHIDADVYTQRVQVAQDLLRNPLVDGRHPPSLFHAFRWPAMILGAAAVILLVRSAIRRVRHYRHPKSRARRRWQAMEWSRRG